MNHHIATSRVLFRTCLLAFAGLAVCQSLRAESPPVRPVEGLELGPDTTVVTGPLNPQGYPDYVAVLNQQMSAGVARDENFWVLMWPALGAAERSGDEYLSAVERELQITISREQRLGFDDPAIVAAFNDQSGPQNNALVLSRPWQRSEVPDLARWFDDNAANLDEVYQASLRPKAYAPLIGGETAPQVIAILLPHVQTLRHAARLQLARANLRMAEGDFEGAWQDLLTNYRIAQHSERGFTLIEQLVGYAIRGMTHTGLQTWLSRCPLASADLELRLAALQPLLAIRNFSTSIDAERYMYLDIVCALKTGTMDLNSMNSMLGNYPMVGEIDGWSNTRRELESAVFRMLVSGIDINETLRFGNGMYDQFVAAASQPTHAERVAAMSKLETQLKLNRAAVGDPTSVLQTYLFASRSEMKTMPGKALTSLLLPALAAVETAYTRSLAGAAVTEAAFAVQARLQQLAAFPATDAGSDTWIGELPADPFTGEPLHVVVDERGVVIYSVGSNLVDDRGYTYGENMEAQTDDVRFVITPRP